MAVRDPAHIVVVDDDPGVCETVRDYLSQEGYRVSVAENGPAMRRILVSDEADLVILDLVMPEEDGLSIARTLRASSDVGIIILTAKGERIDRIIGLEVGADDYIAKPFDLRELLARVRSVLRRAKHSLDVTAVGEHDTLEFAAWSLDRTARRLVSVEGIEVELTTKEFDLLSAFATNADRVLSRDQLLDMVHGREWSPFDRSLDNLISRLRHKIEADPKHPVLIKTVQGVGYVFAQKVSGR